MRLIMETFRIPATVATTVLLLMAVGCSGGGDTGSNDTGSADVPVLDQGPSDPGCSLQCDGRECGDDGCGGICGTCGDNEECNEGKCECVQDSEPCGDVCCATAAVCFSDKCCTPACKDKECGDDGCGSTCGSCDEHYQCEEGSCVYQPFCGDGTCDTDLDENCESCTEDCKCTGDDVCFQQTCCTPDTCKSLTYECGDWGDGCGGDLKCGECSEFKNSFCNESGLCNCTPDCTGKECGDDKCGGVCGTCAAHYQCEAGACIYQPYCGDGTCHASLNENCETCVPDCGCKASAVCFQGGCCTPQTCDSLSKECGDWDNVCGGTNHCGTCQAHPNSFCNPSGQCDCTIACDGKECGADGCGDVCGICGANEECSAQAQCQCVFGSAACGQVCCNPNDVCFNNECCTPDCNGKACGDDGCGGSCGTCMGSDECVNGQCKSELTDGFVKVESGTFWMGSPDGCPGPSGYPGSCFQELGRDDNEDLHYVKLTHSFEMQAHEVTQGEFTTVMGWNPSYFGPNGSGTSCGTTCPVETVSWYDAAAYANHKSVAAGLAPCYVFANVKCEDGTTHGSNYIACMNTTQGGIDAATVTLNGASKPYDCTGYRLPTESEWEYAARAGSNTAFYKSPGNDGTITYTDREPLDPNLNQIGWYGGNSTASYSNYSCSNWFTGATTCGPQPTGGKDSNALGLYDMSGNVWEWVWDWYDSSYPGGTLNSPNQDPVGSATGSYRVRRGGSWLYFARYCRSAYRDDYSPDSRNSYLGFRLSRTLP